VETGEQLNQLRGEASTVGDSVNVESFVRLLRSINRGMFSIADAVLRQYHFPRSGMTIMGQILKKPGITVSQVARQTGFVKSHVSNTIDTLYDQGFVERRQDPQDQRLVRLFATEQSKTRFSEMKKVTDLCVSEVLSVFPRDKLNSLIDGLETLKEALENYEHWQNDDTLGDT